jgi:hypothetical protein
MNKNIRLSIRQLNTEVRSGIAVTWTRFYNLPKDTHKIRQSDLGWNESFTESLSDDECERLTRENIKNMEEAFTERFG